MTSKKRGGNQQARPSQGPEVISKKGHIVNRRTVLGAIGGGVVAAALGDRLWPVIRNSQAQTGAASVDMNRFNAGTSGRPGFGTLGDYVFLSPTKLGGGAHAQDLQSGKTLAWIEYWNYGDSCPIAHHLAAYPSAEARKGFEFVHSTPGGDNVLVYRLAHEVKPR